MNPGRESQTAVRVCMARALAHEASVVPGFSDPTALALLPERARAQLELQRSGALRGKLRGQLRYASLQKLALMMAVRTVAIDRALGAHPTPQLVVLGAGLDGRAWRMPELRDTTVFEVDHPDSQRQKRARVAPLPALARELRYVPVDFTRDDLDTALASAGHDPRLPTTWLWEGVVMYLTGSTIEATLRVLSRRSTPGSRLVVLYHSPALLLLLVSLSLRRLPRSCGT